MLDLPPEHIVSFSLENDRVGVGFTVIENDFGVPKQPFAIGVTVTIEEIKELPGLEVVKDGISPAPSACKPIDVFEFAHV